MTREQFEQLQREQGNTVRVVDSVDNVTMAIVQINYDYPFEICYVEEDGNCVLIGHSKYFKDAMYGFQLERDRCLLV